MGYMAHRVRLLDLRGKRKDNNQQRIPQNGIGYNRVVKGPWALVKMNMGYSVGKIKKKKGSPASAAVSYYKLTLTLGNLS